MNNLYIYFYIATLIILIVSLKRATNLFNLTLILFLICITPKDFIPNIFNFKLISYFLINFLLGILISKRIVNIFFYHFFQKKFCFYNIKYIPCQFVVALREEIVWRYLLVYFVYYPIITIGFNSILAFLIAELVSFFSFLSVHSLGTRQKLLEFCSFLVILIVFSVIMPGFNVSLHMIRNILIISNLHLGVNHEET